MKRIFGTTASQEKAPKPTIQDASSNLEKRGTNLDQKIHSLDVQLSKLKEQISKTRPGPSQESAKRRALQVLKQKRQYEAQRDQLYNQQFNLDQVTFAKESVEDTISTVNALKDAKKELKKQMKGKEFNIDKIEKMQDEMADLMDMQNEIQEVLGQTYDLPDVDESELMDELDALDDELANEADIKNGATPSYLQNNPSMPNVPQKNTIHEKPEEAKDEEIDEFGLPSVPQKN